MSINKRMSILLIFSILMNLFVIQAATAQECVLTAWGSIYNPEGIPVDAILVVSDTSYNEVARAVQAVAPDGTVLISLTVTGNPSELLISAQPSDVVLRSSGFDSDDPACGSGSFIAPPHLQDGRINSRTALDIAAPVAVYPGSDEAFYIYVIDPTNGNGFRLLELDQDRVDEVGIPAQNTLLASDRDPYTGFMVYIYRLSSGEFQINAQYPDGKEYTIIWMP